MSNSFFFRDSLISACWSSLINGDSAKSLNNGDSANSLINSDSANSLIRLGVPFKALMVYAVACYGSVCPSMFTYNSNCL
jgi:hypothetical protein